MTKRERKLLGDLLSAFCEIEEMLDSWSACGLEGLTPSERRRERRRKRAALKVYDRAHVAYLAASLAVTP